MGGRRQVVVCGTKKTIEIKPIEIYDDGSASQMCTDVAYYQNNTWEPDEKIRSKGFDRYDGMMSHFADCVNGITDVNKIYAGQKLYLPMDK